MYVNKLQTRVRHCIVIAVSVKVEPSDRGSYVWWKWMIMHNDEEQLQYTNSEIL